MSGRHAFLMTERRADHSRNHREASLSMISRFLATIAVACLAAPLTAAPPPGDLDTVLKPYAGPSERGVDVKTLTGKVMCGYQGWFNAEGDGAGLGWKHWKGRGGFKPGHCTIDLWPDVSELDPDERYATAFKLADGRPAEVFSSYNRKTVLRHFKWMKDYGIDGAFVQRFANPLTNPRILRHDTTVLSHCREGANRHGRTYAVMYDLSGLGAGSMRKVTDDWKRLIDRMRITKDRAYLHHKGKPVVSIWGFGFSDNRKYTIAEGKELVTWLKNDPQYGGCTVMLGVPTYWRTLRRDCVKDPAMHELIGMADIVSPWTVGRYRTPEQAARHAREVWTPDRAWCRERGKDFFPVVFPGFSWSNMKPGAKLDQIPRLGGRFLWAQYVAAKKAGAKMVYQAMFDEVDEATAIFKCTNKPPVGASKFLTYEGLPSDHYLWLVGQATRMIAGKRPLTETMPKR
jgi:hypothetical protein